MAWHPIFWVERWEVVKVSTQEPGGDQEARERIKLACQTLDEGNTKKRLYAQGILRYQPSQRSAGHQTS